MITLALKLPSRTKDDIITAANVVHRKLSVPKSQYSTCKTRYLPPASWDRNTFVNEKQNSLLLDSNSLLALAKVNTPTSVTTFRFEWNTDHQFILNLNWTLVLRQRDKLLPASTTELMNIKNLPREDWTKARETYHHHQQALGTTARYKYQSLPETFGKPCGRRKFLLRLLWWIKTAVNILALHLRPFATYYKTVVFILTDSHFSYQQMLAIIPYLHEKKMSLGWLDSQLPNFCEITLRFKVIFSLHTNFLCTKTQCLNYENRARSELYNPLAVFRSVCFISKISSVEPRRTREIPNWACILDM